MRVPLENGEGVTVAPRLPLDGVKASCCLHAPEARKREKGLVGSLPFEVTGTDLHEIGERLILFFQMVHPANPGGGTNDASLGPGRARVRKAQ